MTSWWSYSIILTVWKTLDDKFVNKNIIQSDIWGEISMKKKEKRLLGNNQPITQCLVKRKKAPTEPPKLKPKSAI